MSTRSVNALELLRARLATGTVVICIENTYIPNQSGLRLTLNTVGKTYAHATDQHGKADWRITLPTRVRDVEWLAADTVRWSLHGPGAPDRLRGHTVTYTLSTAT